MKEEQTTLGRVHSAITMAKLFTIRTSPLIGYEIATNSYSWESGFVAEAKKDEGT